jgi:PmbA protein
VILAPSVLYHVVNMLLAMVSAETIHDRQSILSEHLGDRAFSEEVTLEDESVSDWKLRSAPFDDEGTPGQATTLIRNGVFEAVLCDKATAANGRFRSSGNGRKLRGRTIIGHSNISLTGRRGWSTRDLMRILGAGLYVGTAGVSCNIRGEIIIIPRNAYWIQHGQVLGMLSTPPRITTTIHRLFGELQEIKGERKLTKHDMLLPHVLTRTAVLE